LLNRKSGSIRTETASPQISLFQDLLAGDLLVAAYQTPAPGGHVWPSGWTTPLNATAASGSFSIAVRFADGSEPAVITVQTGSGKGAYTVFAIRYASPAPGDIATVASTGRSAFPDPAALMLGSAKAYSYLTYAFWGGRDYLRAFPTDYGYFDYSIWDNTGSKGADKTNGALATGFREGQVASSENPGPFMLAGVNNWTAVTLAVSPL